MSIELLIILFIFVVKLNRVFEISNFLSQAEVDHIIELAGGIELGESSTGDVGTNKGKKDISKEEEKGRKTRTSFNSWLPREVSPIIDAIYRRSADLLRMDEALLRHRGPNEVPDMPTKKATSESLQLVHYGPTQEVCSKSTLYCNRHVGWIALTLCYLP